MAQPDRPAPARETPAARPGWADLAWLAGVSSILLLALLPFSSYIASLPFIREEWDMTNAQAGVVFSTYLAGYAISSVVLVPLTDRVSPRRVLMAGVLVMVASNVLFPLLAHNFWVGALLRFIAGAGHVGVYIPGIQLVSLRYAGGKRGTAVAVFVSAGYAGTTISYVFMGMLLDNTPTWRVAYLITALVGVLGVALALLLARESPGQQAASQPAAQGRGRLSVSVLRERSVALVILAYALHTAELYIARLWLPLLLGAALIQGGRGPTEAAALAATLSGLMFMTGIAGVFLGGMVSDYVGRTGGAAIIFALSGACSFAAGWLVGLPVALLIAVGFVYGFATAADSAIYSTAVTELSPRDRIGSTQAVQSFIGFSVGAAAPVAAGYILDAASASSGWGLAFSFNGALAVVGVLALLWLRRLPKAAQMAVGRR
jgi:MFS family permease